MLVDGAHSGESSVHTVTSTVSSSDGLNSSRNMRTNHNSISQYPTQLRSNLGLQVSSLLADHRYWYILTHVFMRPFKLTGVQRRSYQLNIVQHPQKAAEFGYANLSRLPLTPTMVVRLTVRDANGKSIVPYV
jgi:hypothetical protein